MTSNHVIYIPFVFLLGLFSGAVLSRKSNSAGEFSAYRVKGSFLAGAFGLLIAVFVATHMLPIQFGLKGLHAAVGHQPLFDQHPSFSAGEVYERLAGFGELGREAYQRFTYTSDLLFPLSLLLFLALFARFVAERARLPRALLGLIYALPFLWFSSDLIENSIIYWLISGFPGRQDGLAGLLGWVTNAKFAFLLAAVAVPALSCVVRRGEGRLT